MNLGIKKILFILIDPVTIVNFYDHLFKTLSQKYELHILTTKSHISSQLERKGYHINYFSLPVNNPFVFLGMIGSMYRNIKKLKPSLVIGFTLRNQIFGNLISHKLNIPTISPIVGLGPLFESNNFRYRFVRFLYPYALKKTSHIFFYNQSDKELFFKHIRIPDRTHSIYCNGVDTEQFIPQKKVENTDKTVFLMIARLLYDKGIQEYVEAARVVKSTHENVIFYILGRFWNKNLPSNTVTTKKISDWENEGLIKYLGHVEDIRPIIANCDCIVLPSFREGCSNVLMEGGSMAKPLLASNVPGCKELINNNKNGYIFRPKSAMALAESCLKFIQLSPQEQYQMGIYSRDFMCQKYKRSDWSKKFIQKIDEVLCL